jgi:general secretion pathway protein L
MAPPAKSAGLSVLRSFLEWWRGELVAIVPASLRDGTARPPRALLVHLGGETIRIEALNGSRRRELGNIAAMPALPDAERRALESLVSRRRLERGEIGLVLPDLRVLRKTLEFPLAAEGDLDAIIANQIDRLTPYRPGQLRYSHRVVSRDHARRRVCVELAAVAVGALDPALTRLAAWDVRPSFVWIEAAEDGDPLAIDLRPRGGARAQRGRPRLIPVLAAANAALLLMAAGLPLWDRHREEARLVEQVAAAKLRADAVLRLRANVEAVRGEIAFLSGRQARLPIMVVALDELTRVVPDGTWIEELRLDQNGLDLRGHSPQASAMIGATEASPMFRKVEFRAPVTRQGALGTERFHISAELDIGAAP